MTSERFGEQIPFCEPHWYQGGYSPYYNDGHKKFRAVVRKFVEDEIKPNLDKWIKEGYPVELHKRSYELGIQGIIYPNEHGGTQPKDYDIFYELVMCDELARAGGGNVLGQSGINSMALPPIMIAGSAEIKKKVLRDVISGEKNICLAISEPTAGSDVANIRTTAVRQGDHYVVNGTKKWITGGLFGDFFTTAVRTGGEGAGGISLLLLEKNMPGVNVRKMETQFDNSHNTTFINLEDVRVPVSNLIGTENAGFKLIMHNFNHERLVLAAGACRAARLCYEQSIKYALQRTTFNKRLIEHQIIRMKLAEMARLIEALQDNLDRVAFQFKCNIPQQKLGGPCALLKVNASKTFEFCAREASQIFGGNSIVKEGKGKVIERLYREVRSAAIPGGSEEILLDLSIRQIAKL
ncbi:medium-chain specific acyl-CoA dehydrogenase, mitochondrial [Acrasis kona]|uniref:Medium-chain specific acyl-CoA dehydrogenase, mitochondrial n=1 Tax=Acrasis kona TaxID=1008807 RepID=A0AAW2YMB6_9EUKA